MAASVDLVARTAAPEQGEPTAGHECARRADLFYYCVYACLALLFTVILFKCTRQYPRATLAALTDLRAETPFQYRILVPWLVRVVHTVVPVRVEYLYAVSTVGATFALLLAFRCYLGLFVARRVASACAVLLLYPMLWNYCALSGWYYPADVPAILFFVLGLILIFKRRWALYYPLFILASLNRETSCFLILAFVFTSVGRDKPARIIAHAACQVVIWLGIKSMLTSLFMSNPGAKFFEFQVWGNIDFLLAVLRMEPSPLGKVFTFGLIWLLIPFGKSEQPVFLRRLLWVAVPFIVGMGVAGCIHEVRIYSELIPVLTAPAVYGLMKLTQTTLIPQRPSAR